MAKKSTTQHQSGIFAIMESTDSKLLGYWNPKMALTRILIIALFIALAIPSASALTNIDSCQNLNVANEVYNLTANVNNESTCFTI